MKRKFLILLLTCVICWAFDLSACTVGDESNNGVQEQGNENDDEQGGTETTAITFDEFISDHSDKAVTFIDNYIYDDVIGDKEVVSQNWYISANEDDELDLVEAVYTYKGDDTSRVVEYASVTLSAPVDLDDIVNGTVGEFTNIVSRTDILEFDAQTVSENQDVALALYTNSDIADYAGAMVYTEVETSNAYTRGFNYLEFTGNEINIHYTELYNDSDDSLVSDLGNSNCIKTVKISDSYSIEGTNMIAESYELEDFNNSTIDPENPEDPSKEETIESLADLVENYSAEVYAALSEYHLENMGKTLFGKVSYDKDNIIDVTWDLGTNDKIETIKCLITYSTNESTYFISLGTIDLSENPIYVTSLNEENITKVFEIAVNDASYTYEYKFSYIPQKQGTRDDLVDAIFTAYGIAKTDGATRLFIDNGPDVDTTLGSDAKSFTVVEVNDNNIIQFTIRIKTSSTDAGLINNLNDTSNYRFTQEKSYELGGYKITSSNATTTSASAINLLTLGDDNNIEL